MILYDGVSLGDVHALSIVQPFQVSANAASGLLVLKKYWQPLAPCLPTPLHPVPHTLD